MAWKKAALTLMRLTSRHCASAPHCSISEVQKARPGASGSRLRKSRYCWRTNFCESSMGLGRPAAAAYACGPPPAGGGAAAKLEGLSTRATNASNEPPCAAWNALAERGKLFENVYPVM